MKLAILGYGVEGKSIEKYFQTHPYENVPPENIEIKVFNDFKDEDIENLGLDDYDVIFRSPSVRPHYDFKKYETDIVEPGESTEHLYFQEKPYWTSATKYFFQHCPCEIIAVSGTKGKGTTCSMITAILQSIHQQIYQSSKKDNPQVYLVGNIGTPCLDILDKIEAHDEVVFEMSSFQLWDLHTSSSVSVLLRIEPDHLNVHYDLDDYHYAKSTLARYKKATDYLIYFRDNETTKFIAEASLAHKIPYPISDVSGTSKSGANKHLIDILDSLQVPGEHNRENAEAALLAVAARYTNGNIDTLLDSELFPAVKSALANFQGLPHRCQFLRELNNVKYYDDNYSSALPALDVALKTFEKNPTVLICGGMSRGIDQQIKKRVFSAPNLEKAILIGESAETLAEGEKPERYELASSLAEAVKKARVAAEKIATKDTPAIVVMSPGFPSFDMFKNFTERGEQYTKLVKELK